MYFVIVTLPKVEFNSEINTTSVDESSKVPLNILRKPISTSFAVFDEDTILADPCGEEESLSLGLLTIVVAGDELCSIHKPGIKKNRIYFYSLFYLLQL